MAKLALALFDQLKGLLRGQLEQELSGLTRTQMKRALLDQLMKLKPQTSKGTYMRSITISTTHGPGIKIDPTPFTAGAEAQQ